MKRFHNASLKFKQTAIIMATTTIALLLACIVFAVYEVISFRTRMLTDLTTMADIIGDNCAASIDFNDAKSAQETLSALKAEKNIVRAYVYTKDGQLLASYDRENDGRTMVAPPFQLNGHHFGKEDLTLFDQIDYKGDVVGSVYLASDMEELYSQLRKYAAITLGVFFLALLVAYFLSARLQRVVSEPILNLVETAHAVARDRNYSLRAIKHGKDELGTLADAFNEMLTQIQTRDSELRAIRNNLEVRVAERTNELERENAERKRAEISLAETSSLMEAMMANSVDYVYFKDLESRFVRCSRSLTTAFRESNPDALIGKTDFDFFSEDRARSAFDDEQAIIRTGQPLISKPEKEIREDGRAFWVLSTKLPWHDKEGKIRGTFGISKDITAIKEAEGKLEQAHRQLIDISRQAGMAEVATSVLHNVGNVLNSVNISSSLVSEKMKSSKMVNLSKVVGLIQANGSDLGRFFTEDPKGRQLPGYLATLAEHLTDEKEEILEELSSLSSNIEHIKEIVSMQQSYARVSGVTAEHSVVDLVEDAIRMNIGAINRHQVTVVRDFQQTPVAVVDKHKVLQILVNLMRNAKYALDDGMPAVKQMTVRVTATGDERVRIAVIDNGIGIPADNLTRIFGHGFTTRKEGHGFGLHSGALAAKELGGSLTVRSEGTGKGATFELDFPIQPAKEPHS